MIEPFPETPDTEVSPVVSSSCGINSCRGVLHNAIRSVLGENSEGLRLTAMYALVSVKAPRSSMASMQTTVFNMTRSGEVVRPKRGFYTLAK